MRRRSIAGPSILILLGVLFLVYNLRPELRILESIAVYWPFLLIAWGLIRLAEVVVSFMRGQPQRGGFSGGEVVLIVFICLAGSAAYSAQRHGIRLGMRGVEMFGQAYDFPVSAERPATGDIRRVVFENRRGNLRITGSDAQEIRAVGNMTIRAVSRADAERTYENTPLQIVVEGDTAIVRTNQERVPENLRIAADLEVTVPRGVRVELRGRQGDYDVSDLDGHVEIAAERADVRLNRIGGNVRVDLRRSNVVRALDVKGSVDVQGRGNDVELENVSGQVIVGGSYAGSLEFKNLAKPLRFESPNTDLRVEALPGQISINLGGFTARNVVGPIRLTTKSRDVKIEDFSNTLDLETERGDIELQPGRLPLARIEARARSGRIDLILPDKASFQLRATTEQGDAVNDFGPPIQKESEGRSASLRGEVGKGPAILLNTGRGAVSVRKAPEGSPRTQL